MFVIYVLIGALTANGAISLRHLPVNEQLSSNMLNAIHQDANGFIYFGTATGLHRYDGHRIISYINNPQDSTSIIDNYVQDIQTYHNDMLLVKAGDKYCIFDPKTGRFDCDITPKLKKYNISKYPGIITVDGLDIWLTVEGEGIFRYSPKDGVRKVAGIERYADEEITDLIVQPDHKEAFAITDTGKILIVNTSAMALKGVSDTPDHSDGNRVYSLYADRDGIIWVFAETGLYAYELSSDRWIDNFGGISWPDGIPNIVTQDRKGRIWIGYNHGGIAVINKHGGIELIRNVESDSRSLAANTVSSLFEDKTGTMWIGTRKKGVSIYNESSYKFDFHKFPDVNCIIPASDGNLWIGTDTDGLFLTDAGYHTLKTYGNGRESKAIVCLLPAKDGTLYAGTYAGGILAVRNGLLSTITEKDGLSSDNVWSMMEDDDGRILIATLGGGFQVYDPKSKTFETYNMENSRLTSRFATSLTPNGRGGVYIGTSCGVADFDPSTRQISMITGTRDKSKSLSNLIINQVFYDSRGLLWIGTRSGLNIYNPAKDKLMELNIDAVPGQNFILGIAEDQNHSMWVSIGGTLTNIRVAEDKDADFPEFTFHNYNSSDGLQNCDFNQRSFCMLPNGEMLVGGLYGINSFKPEKILFNTYNPRVKLTGMMLNNTNVRIGEKYDGNIILPEDIDYMHKIHLKHSQNNFTLFFSTDDYVLPEKMTFSYKLDGFDDKWIELPVGTQQISYTNLSPGTYTLYVKATNNDGVSSTDIKSVSIRITPPWYGSITAKIIYILLFIGLLFLAIYLVRKRERRIYLTKIREEKHRKQEDLNQLKFRFFTNISHELRTPLTLITAPLDSMIAKEEDDAKKKKLSVMKANANRLLNLVNQILDFRKNEISGLTFQPSSGNIVSFARQICDSFLSFSEKRNIKFSFSASSENINMVFDEDKMGKTIMNLLSNAFKYTPDNGTVDMDVSEKSDTLIITVSDSGKGISDEDKKHIFDRFFQASNGDNNSAGSGIGLSLVAEYVKLHHGKVFVSDNPGGGTIFTVKIPVIRSDSDNTEASAGESYAEDIHDIRKSDGNEKPLVMVIDDNADLLELIFDEFSSDFKIVTAENGKVALPKIKTSFPDLIISDIMMPEMDGIELCRRLKSNPATANIPLIILTAKHDMTAKIEGLTLGADDYVTKPFNIEELRLRIDRLIALKKKGFRRNLIDPEPEKIQITSLDKQLIEKAVKYVEKNIDNPDLSVEEMSASLGMSRVHLYKRIKHLTGKTPIEFIRIIRLKRAAQLLKESQLNVSEIAYKCGFNNPKYFSRYFKDEFGILPSAYQENNKE